MRNTTRLWMQWVSINFTRRERALKIKRGYYWCSKIKCEDILSLCSPHTSFDKSNQKNIDFRMTGNAKMLTRFWVFAYKNTSSLRHSVDMFDDMAAEICSLITQPSIWEAPIKSAWNGSYDSIFFPVVIYIKTIATSVSSYTVQILCIFLSSYCCFT